MTELDVYALQELQGSILELVEKLYTDYEIDCVLSIDVKEIYEAHPDFFKLVRKTRIKARLKMIDMLHENLNNKDFNFMAFKAYCYSRGIALKTSAASKDVIKSMEEEDYDVDVALDVAKVKDTLNSAKTKELDNDESTKEHILVIKDYERKTIES